MTHASPIARTRIVAGIDVGGPRKGFHGVALSNGAVFARFATRDAEAMATWCTALAVTHVGIDAPGRWSADGRRRAGERALAAAGIACFASPTREAALAHEVAAARSGKAGWYGWMFEGEKLYAALRPHYSPLETNDGEAPCCFETFPQAIACALARDIVSVQDKRRVRRALLHAADIDTAALTNIDWLDAALCALAADSVARGQWRAYGTRDDGYIVVPSVS